MAKAKDLCERLVERAIAMEGTCTGEHGVGQGKMKYLAAEYDAVRARRDARRSSARSIPDNIMNPGQDRPVRLTRTGANRAHAMRDKVWLTEKSQHGIGSAHPYCS